MENLETEKKVEQIIAKYTRWAERNKLNAIESELFSHITKNTDPQKIIDILGFESNYEYNIRYVKLGVSIEKAIEHLNS